MIKVYDNKESFDRYTVIIHDSESNIYNFYGMSEYADGVNQFLGDSRDGYEAGPHLGELLNEVPLSIKEAVKQRMVSK